MEICYKWLDLGLACIIYSVYIQELDSKYSIGRWKSVMINSMDKIQRIGSNEMLRLSRQVSKKPWLPATAATLAKVERRWARRQTENHGLLWYEEQMVDQQKQIKTK